jgi:hypothetical protein
MVRGLVRSTQRGGVKDAEYLRTCHLCGEPAPDPDLVVRGGFFVHREDCSETQAVLWRLGLEGEPEP